MPYTPILSDYIYNIISYNIFLIFYESIKLTLVKWNEGVRL